MRLFPNFICWLFSHPFRVDQDFLIIININFEFINAFARIRNRDKYFTCLWPIKALLLTSDIYFSSYVLGQNLISFIFGLNISITFLIANLLINFVIYLSKLIFRWSSNYVWLHYEKWSSYLLPPYYIWCIT